jgi:general secretion pathway protein G
MTVRRTRKGGFTLVEILIVVIILGILAAIVIPQFTSASQDARKNSLTSQLQTIRSQVELYKLQHLDQLPNNWGGNGNTAAPTWDAFTSRTDKDGATGTDAATYPFGPYLQAVPTNPLNGGTAILAGTTDYTGGEALDTSTNKEGFVLNTANGKVWGTSAKHHHIYNEGDPSNATNDD